MLKKLAVYRRQNQFDLALQELGRIERILFTSASPAFPVGAGRRDRRQTPPPQSRPDASRCMTRDILNPFGHSVLNNNRRYALLNSASFHE
jgi:hypothetical protein